MNLILEEPGGETLFVVVSRDSTSVEIEDGGCGEGFRILTTAPSS
jgi:hypothetical protein